MALIAQETPKQDAVKLLLRRSDELSAALYPPESRHLVGIDALGAPEVRFFVARVGKRAVGCAALVLGYDGRAEIKRMFVDPAARGQGVGTELLEEIEKAARCEGVRLLQLETGGGNREALRLYRRCGYRECGPFGGYRPDQLSVFMEKEMPPLRAPVLVTSQLPTFRTPRLMVRQRTMEDLEWCMAMDRDPEVTRFLPGPWTDPVAHRAFVEERIRHAYPVGMGYWSITAPEGFVGWILLTPVDLHGPEIEIAWRLVRAAWGRGYATEAAQPVLDHALYTLGLKQVIADIDPANIASIKVAQKLGFRPAGSVPFNGRTVTRYIAERATDSDDPGQS